MEASRLPRILDRAALFLVAFQIVLRLCVSSGTGLNLFIDGVLWAAAAVWLAGRMLEGRWTLRLSGVEIPLAVFLILSVLSIFWASYRLQAIQTAASFATLALLAPLSANAFAERRALAVRLLIASVAALAVYAFLQRFWILPAQLDQWTAEKRNLGQNILDRAASGEIWATFGGYPNAFGAFLAILLPVAAGALIDTKKLRVRVVCGATIALGLAALWLTGSGGAWIAAAVGAVLFRALLSERRAVLLTVAAAGLVAVVAVGPRLMRTESMQVRSVYWSASALMAKDRPILGVGAGNFGEYYYQYRDDRQEESNKAAHNDYLQLLVELGLLGLLAYLAFLAMTVRAGLRADDEPPPEPDHKSVLAVGWAIPTAIMAAVALGGLFLDVSPEIVIPIVLAVWGGVFVVAKVAPGRATRLGLLAGLIAGCVHSLVDWDLYSPGTAATIFLAAGLLATGRPVAAGRRSAFVPLAFVGAATAILALVAPGFMDADSARLEGRFAEAVSLNPLDADAWDALGQEKAAHGDRAGAYAAIDQAILHRPRHAPYHHRRGTLCEQGGRFEEALQSYARAVELYPTHARGQFDLARMLDRLDRRDEAVPHYRRALELEALARRVDARLKLTQKERDQAISRTTPSP